MLKSNDDQRITRHKSKNTAAEQKKGRQRLLVEQRLNQQEKYGYQSGAFD